MSKKQKPLRIRKTSSRATSDRKLIRFGGGMAPVCLSRDPQGATRDRGRVRFGGGMISATLKK
jgi:hypothetical protein